MVFFGICHLWLLALLSSWLNSHWIPLLDLGQAYKLKAIMIWPLLIFNVFGELVMGKIARVDSNHVSQCTFVLTECNLQFKVRPWEWQNSPCSIWKLKVIEPQFLLPFSIFYKGLTAWLQNDGMMFARFTLHC